MAILKKFCDQAKILQFDVDAAEINKNIRVTSSVIGDVKEILTRINKSSHSLTTIHGLSMCLHMQRLFPLTYHKEGLSGPFVIEKIYEMTKGNAIMVTESASIRCGQPSITNTASQEHFLHQEVLVPWDTVSVLQSVPRQPNPDRTVVNIAGDG